MMLGPKLEVMRRLGAKDGDAIFGHGEWWRLLSCSWLHAGLFHLVGRMNVADACVRLFREDERGRSLHEWHSKFAGA